jgi:hypothetical protein
MRAALGEEKKCRRKSGGRQVWRIQVCVWEVAEAVRVSQTSKVATRSVCDWRALASLAVLGVSRKKKIFWFCSGGTQCCLGLI